MGDMADYYADHDIEERTAMAMDFTINRTVTIDVSQLDSMESCFVNSRNGGARLTLSGQAAEAIGNPGTVSRVVLKGPRALGKTGIECGLYSGTRNSSSLAIPSLTLTVAFASELDALRAAKMFEAHAKRTNKAVAKTADDDGLLYYVGSPTVAAGWKKATLEEAVAHAERLAAETGREQTVVEIVRRVKVGTRTRVVTPVKPRRKPEPTAKSVRAKARGLLRKTTRKKKS